MDYLEERNVPLYGQPVRMIPIVRNRSVVWRRVWNLWFTDPYHNIEQAHIKLPFDLHVFVPQPLFYCKRIIRDDTHGLQPQHKR
jgi:hypothetical protein